MNISSKICGRTAAIVMASALAFIGWAPRPAQAQWAVECVNCSSWWQQMMQYAEQAETALNTAQQLETQIKQYNAMIKQGLALPNQVWGDFQSDMNQLNGLMSQGRNIAYSTSNLNTKFKALFPDYQHYVTDPLTKQSASTAYEKWSGQTYDAARTALEAAGMQAGQMRDENDVMRQLQQHSASAAGQMQAIQAGNEIAAQQVRQLQKLRQLVMAQMTMQANTMAAHQRELDAKRGAITAAHEQQPDPSSAAQFKVH